MTESTSETPQPWLEELPPRQIVAELDRYIIGQAAAKKAIAIALRNRWRRSQAPEGIRDEITPSNIILIGPTGVGKTEIARRLARLAGAPFLKVEASRFTEVGYVGRDVESMVRDLIDAGVSLVRNEREDAVWPQVEAKALERLLELLLPPLDRTEEGVAVAPDDPLLAERRARSLDKLRQQLVDGKLEEREVEVDSSPNFPDPDSWRPPDSSENPDFLGDWGRDFGPRRGKRRMMKVRDARRLLEDEELRQQIDMDDVVSEALERVENHGIVFIDEIDKIAGERNPTGPDVSRQGVQRDLLPIVEGSTVQTRHGAVRTDHVLFVAAGAFHVAKPSDMIPELQGRFPIRVELDALTEGDFVRILTEPENALTKQYAALVGAEQVELRFTEEAIAELARTAWDANDRMENIGARRLHTVMAALMEELLFDLPDGRSGAVVIDAPEVKERLANIVNDDDLRKYIL